MDIIIFILFTLLSFVLIALDIYRDIPYLGVFGGILLILMGTVISMDVVDVTQTFCQPTYNYTSISCIDQKLNVNTSMNAGIGAMFWLVGLGVVLDAIFFHSLNVRRD